MKNSSDNPRTRQRLKITLACPERLERIGGMMNKEQEEAQFRGVCMIFAVACTPIVLRLIFGWM